MNEEFLSKKQAIELFDSGNLARLEVGTAKGLQDIHHYLFQDVFDFAGKIREVDLAKGNFRFAPAIYLADVKEHFVTGKHKPFGANFGAKAYWHQGGIKQGSVRYLFG